MRAYLEVDLPLPLSTHLFLAFSQKPRQETPDHPKEGASGSEPNVSGTRTSFPQDGRMLSICNPWPTGIGTPLARNLSLGSGRETKGQGLLPFRPSEPLSG